MEAYVPQNGATVTLVECSVCGGIMAAGGPYHDSTVVNKQGEPLVTDYHAAHSA